MANLINVNVIFKSDQNLDGLFLGDLIDFDFLGEWTTSTLIAPVALLTLTANDLLSPSACPIADTPLSTSCKYT